MISIGELNCKENFVFLFWSIVRWLTCLLPKPLMNVQSTRVDWMHFLSRKIIFWLWHYLRIKLFMKYFFVLDFNKFNTFKRLLHSKVGPSIVFEKFSISLFMFSVKRLSDRITSQLDFNAPFKFSSVTTFSICSVCCLSKPYVLGVFS